MNNFARSLAIHAVIVALVLLCGSTIHPVIERQRFHSTLIFPMTDLPVPVVAPRGAEQPANPSTAGPTVSNPAPLGTAPALLTMRPASPEAAPRPVKLDTSSPLALPQATQRKVTAAPVAHQVGFEQQTGAIGSNIGRGVAVGGFGSTSTGSQGTGRSGESHLALAGFSMSTEARSVATSRVQPRTQPVILWEPSPVYSTEARAAGIQGVVDIRVKFRVDGSIEVLGVVNGLPGLTDSALAVVRGIKFTPAAEDFTTTVHVRFELS